MIWKKKKNKTLSESTPNLFKGGGFFQYVESKEPIWKDITNGLDLDILYYCNHSGDKIISPLVLKGLDNTNPFTLEQVYDTVYNAYVKNWSYVWDALFANYNPIYNYNMKENEEVNNTGVDIETLSKRGSEAEYSKDLNEMTKSGDRTNTKSGSTDFMKSNFNSSSTKYYPDTQEKYNKITDTESFSNYKDSHEISMKHSKTYGIKFDENGNEVYDENGYQEETKYQNGKNVKRELTRDGNIGVTTSQQMIESELELRKQNFFEYIFKDIDKYLVLSVY